MKSRTTVVCLAIALAVFCIQRAGRAQQQSDSSYEAKSDRFFDMLQQDKGSEAVGFIFGANAKQLRPADLEELKKQFGSISGLCGPYVSRAKLVETKVGGMFVYQHYMVAYEKQPISVRIKYYKPGKEWLCYGLQFDTKLDDEIQKVSDEKISAEFGK